MSTEKLKKGLSFPVAVCAGSLLLFFAFSHIGIFAWIALVPLTLFAVSERSYYKVMFFSWLAGSIFYFIGVSWLRHVTWWGLFAASLCILSLYFVMFALIIKLSFRGQWSWRFILFASAVWTGLEYLHTITPFGLLWYSLAYSQYGLKYFIQGADIVGSFGLSFLIASFNISLAGAIYEGFSRRHIKRLAVIAAVFLALSIYGAIRISTLKITKGERIAVIQGNIPQEVKELNLNPSSVYFKHAELTKKALAESPDMVIWAETMFPYLVTETSGAIEHCQELASNIKAHFLVGAVVIEESENDKRVYNSAYLFPPDNTAVQRYDKINLVLVSERIPLKDKFPFIKQLILRFTELKDLPGFDTGKEIVIFNGPRHKFGVLICFESVFSYLARENVLRGADYLINMTNDGWFKDSFELRQALIITAFRAIETRRGIVRAANTGISAFIEPDGSINELKDRAGRTVEIEGWLVSEASICSNTSLYLVLGEFFPVVCLLIVIAKIFAIFLRNRLKKQA